MGATRLHSARVDVGGSCCGAVCVDVADRNGELVALFSYLNSSGFNTSFFLTPSWVGRGAPRFGTVTSTQSSSSAPRIDGSGTCSGMKYASGWPRHVTLLPPR